MLLIFSHASFTDLQAKCVCKINHMVPCYDMANQTPLDNECIGHGSGCQVGRGWTLTNSHVARDHDTVQMAEFHYTVTDTLRPTASRLAYIKSINMANNAADFEIADLAMIKVQMPEETNVTACLSQAAVADPTDPTQGDYIFCFHVSITYTADEFTNVHWKLL
jgi:hypothetical protein